MSFKRILSLVLVLCMVLSFFPASAFADYDDEDVIVEEEVVEEEAYAEEPVVEEYAEEPVVEEIIEDDAETFATDAAFVTYVARDDAGKEYETLAAAFLGVAAGGTITVTGNPSDGGTVTKDVTLTFEGDKRIYGTITVDGATLKVTGTQGKITAVNVISGGCLSVDAGVAVKILSASATGNVVPGVKGGVFTTKCDEKLLAYGYKRETNGEIKTIGVDYAAVIDDTARSYFKADQIYGADGALATANNSVQRLSY
jgi:hypothetical protein